MWLLGPLPVGVSAAAVPAAAVSAAAAVAAGGVVAPGASAASDVEARVWVCPTTLNAALAAFLFPSCFRPPVANLQVSCKLSQAQDHVANGCGLAIRSLELPLCS